MRLSGWLETLSPIIDQVNSALMACDSRGTIVLFNSEAERILGVSRKEVLGRSVVGEPRCPGPALIGLSRVLEEALQAGEQYRRQTMPLQEGNGPSLLGYTTSTLFGPDDEPLGAMVAFADLTAQERLRNAAGQEAEQLTRMSRLASLLAHEIKNPLATIQLYASLLLSEAEGDVREAASVITAEVAKARQRLDSIRAGLSAAAPNEAPLPGFCDLARQALRLHRDYAGAADAETSQQPVHVPLSKVAASALISHLAQYVEACPGLAGQTESSLSCRVSRDGDQARLVLAPASAATGSPAPPPASAAGAGTADLNLWLAEQIVQRARGRLLLQEAEGGVVATAILPLLTPSRLRGRTVLVVDDEESLRNLVSRLLVSVGAEPLEAADGSAALEILASRPPALVVTDAIMPKLDGYGLAEATPLDIPVLIVSGAGGPAPSATSCRHVASLSKPFSSEEMLMSLAYLAWEAGL